MGISFTASDALNQISSLSQRKANRDAATTPRRLHRNSKESH